MSDADEDFDGGAAAEVEEEEEERFDEEEEEEEDRFRTRTAPALPPRTPFAGLTPFAPSSFAPQTVPPPPPTAAAAASVGLVPQTPMTPMTPGPVHHILQNIVSTVNLGCRLDLKKIALGARNAEYNPRRFAAVIMRIREPKTTALIFGSGKMVCTGAKSVDDAKLASKKYARIVQKLGFPAKFLEFKVQNMVASADVRFPIRLEGIAFAQPRFSSYEPELFPGLIYRMIQPKVVLLIFVSGKVVLTGAKDEAQIAQAFSNILPVLYGHKKAV